jgi:hypothetical protein
MSTGAEQRLSVVRRQLFRLRGRLERALPKIERDTEQGRAAWTAVDEAKLIVQGLVVAVGPLTEDDLRAIGEEGAKGAR